MTNDDFERNEKTPGFLGWYKRNICWMGPITVTCIIAVIVLPIVLIGGGNKTPEVPVEVSNSTAVVEVTNSTIPVESANSTVPVISETPIVVQPVSTNTTALILQ